MILEIMFIRHGATKSNREHRYLGRTDEGLSREGILALQEKKERGIYGKPEIVFGGPMLRCRQTAGILFPGLRCRCIREWTEIDFGMFEGKNYQELSDCAAYRTWVDQGGTLPFPEGESREGFLRRSLRGLDDMLACARDFWEEEKEAYGEVLKAAAVVHGGTIMALGSSLFGGDYFDYQIKCGEGFWCRLQWTDRQKVEGAEIKRI